jgi:hypothetical protein
MQDPARAPQPDLFSASLSAGPVEAGFSQQASFFVAFFGGPLAAVLFSAWNARLWGRLRRDLPLAIALALVTAAAIWAAVHWSAQLEAAGYPQRSMRLGVRALALGIWGIFALRHRALYRMQGLSSLKPRSPWIPGLVCAGVSTVLAIGVALIAKLLGGVE